MLMKNHLILLLGLSLLGGCAIPERTSSLVRAAITGGSSTIRDDQTKCTVFESSKVYLGEGSSLFDAKNYYRYDLRAVKPDIGEVRYLLVLNNLGLNDWVFWDSAADQNGKQFKFSDDDRDVHGRGTPTETVVVSLSRDYLDSIKASGATWKIIGRYNNSELEIQARLLAGFLQSSDAQFASK